MATRAELDAYNLIVDVFPGAVAEVWDGKHMVAEAKVVEEVDQVVEDPEVVKSRMPKDVWMVTWKGRTPGGRKQLLGRTFTKKTDAERVFGLYRKWGFVDVKLMVTSARWDEVGGKPRSVQELEDAGVEVPEMFPA